MTADKSQYNIMVIEDNPGDFALVEDFIFEHIEAPVIIRAVNYASADKILIANNVPFDIILLDLSLPDLTGLELIKAILNLAHNTPVIVLTGYSDFAFGVKSLSLGVADYILKDDLTSLALYKSIVYSVERKGIVLALEESEKRVRAFATQLNNALEEERSRIAREIHDEFGQQLSGLKMSLSSLRKIKDVPEELINAMVADVDVSIQSVRQIANELRPVLIDRLGLFAALEWLVTEFEKKTGIASYLYINASAPAIDKM
ncbi:MAG: ATP-binding response regulator, partial [Mucilaginibacter sp.]